MNDVLFLICFIFSYRQFSNTQKGKKEKKLYSYEEHKMTGAFSIKIKL